MLKQLGKYCALLVMGLTLNAVPKISYGEITERHREVTHRVMQRLLAVMEEPEGWEVWPPKIEVIEPGYPNAMAGFRTEDGVDVPFVFVTVKMIEQIAEFEENALAFTLAHE